MDYKLPFDSDERGTKAIVYVRPVEVSDLRRKSASRSATIRSSIRCMTRTDNALRW